VLITVRRLVNPGNFGHRQEESNCPSQQLLKMNQAYTNQRAVVGYFREREWSQLNLAAAALLLVLTHCSRHEQMAFVSTS
jgi:hypothetical protein